MRALPLMIGILASLAGAPRTHACEPVDFGEPLIERGDEARPPDRLAATRDGVWWISWTPTQAIELRNELGPAETRLERVGAGSLVVHVPSDAEVGDAYTLAGAGLDSLVVVDGSVADLARPSLGAPEISREFFKTSNGCDVGFRSVTSHDRALLRYATDASTSDTVLEAWQLESGHPQPADDDERAIEAAPLEGDGLVTDGVLVLTAEAVGTYDVIARVRDVRTGLASDTQRTQVTVAGPAYAGCTGFGFGCSASGAPSPIVALLVALGLRRRGSAWDHASQSRSPRR